MFTTAIFNNCHIGSYFFAVLSVNCWRNFPLVPDFYFKLFYLIFHFSVHFYDRMAWFVWSCRRRPACLFPSFVVCLCAHLCVFLGRATTGAAMDVADRVLFFLLTHKHTQTNNQTTKQKEKERKTEVTTTAINGTMFIIEASVLLLRRLVDLFFVAFASCLDSDDFFLLHCKSNTRASHVECSVIVVYCES